MSSTLLSPLCAPLHDAFRAPNVRQLGVTVFSTA